jgi:hypothetical protein
MHCCFQQRKLSQFYLSEKIPLNNRKRALYCLCAMRSPQFMSERFLVLNVCNLLTSSKCAGSGRANAEIGNWKNFFISAPAGCRRIFVAGSSIASGASAAAADASGRGHTGPGVGGGDRPSGGGGASGAFEIRRLTALSGIPRANLPAGSKLSTRNWRVALHHFCSSSVYADAPTHGGRHYSSKFMGCLKQAIHPACSASLVCGNLSGSSG